MSDSAGAPARPARRPALPKVLSAAVFALAGVLFWTSFDTAHGGNIRSDDSLLRTSDLIRSKSHQNAELEQQLSGLRGEVDSRAHRESGQSAADQSRTDALARTAGTKPLIGNSITVTLNDAPPNATARVPGVPEPQPNDLVIHQQDLQAVVNALWRGGAQGIQVMDQRLISTSAVRCVGNTLLLQGRVYSPPYTITAVGDQNALRTALDQDPSITNYRQYVTAYGLGWKVEAHNQVTLPGYSGTVNLHYAQPMG
ncbi:DUF881 domain-containing protein [Streptantibioticus ferralitis]|uniref:DUF881 domain-containing protein n=1 Tax=Streptantibioticus ferralitis TaxID=236510 RepID=A0ABT5Z560_9ACTN|nr:DUF881 domain-containing protein [Streptantibioticus ferralitis]MDF2258944.1 DUF881 domain-containing protein [Streptantibioticus ferralitis]